MDERDVRNRGFGARKSARLGYHDVRCVHVQIYTFCEGHGLYPTVAAEGFVYLLFHRGVLSGQNPQHKIGVVLFSEILGRD